MSAAPIVVATAVDAGYLPFALVVATSIARNASPDRPVEFHVLYDGPDHWAVEKLEQFRRGSLRVQVHRLPNPWAYLGVINHFPPSTFFRLAIPQVLAQYSRAIYLDCDVIVEDDLSPLFDTDLGGLPIGAVPCVLTIISAIREGTAVSGGVKMGAGEYFRDVLDLDTHDRQLHYSQAGVQLLDLDLLRRIDYAGQMTAVIERLRDKLAYADQCAFNLLMRDRIASIDPRWNVPPFALLRGALRFAPVDLKPIVRRQHAAPGIIHYGGPKPWGQLIVPGTLRWWRHAVRSGAFRYFLGLPKHPSYRIVMADVAYDFPRLGVVLRKLDILWQEHKAKRKAIAADR